MERRTLRSDLNKLKVARDTASESRNANQHGGTFAQDGDGHLATHLSVISVLGSVFGNGARLRKMAYADFTLHIYYNV